MDYEIGIRLDMILASLEELHKKLDSITIESNEK